ncbi:GNAT family N-acetyltransferase [Halobacteriales archaeon SW_8_65_20]|nr:MAG: GNAT family N-acetyltransferase [Halobacteriales archaeon SW_8_65_20]
MEFDMLGDATGGPKLRLDWQRFSYAGKFVMTNTGKGVFRTGDRGSGAFDASIVAAVSFNEDRTDDRTAWLRYVTVREDRRGEGIGSRLCRRVSDGLLDSYDRVQIAVNNPFAYEALYKSGFGFTGTTTGVAELVLQRPHDRDPETYRSGLDRYRSRELSAAEQTFLDGRSRPPGER